MTLTHVTRQFPLTQRSIAEHAWPQAPQLFGSVDSVEHVPLQLASPAEQPVVHAYWPGDVISQSGVPPLHGVLQAPQFVVVARLTVHPWPVLPHSAKPVAQLYTQWPLVHARPVADTFGSAAQLFPHPPQLKVSSFSSTQMLPQSACPLGHASESASAPLSRGTHTLIPDSPVSVESGASIDVPLSTRAPSDASVSIASTGEVVASGTGVT
jgi:hypothetical protein